MKRYAHTLLTCFALSIVLFAGFNVLIDPYGISGAPDIPGLTTRDTRLRQDGGRVHVGNRLAMGGDTSVLLGSSRTVDGFPHDPTDWPGGIFNAGMRGTNMFELGRAMALAARNPELRCLVIGLDMDEFGTHGKAKATYWLSALTDGNRSLSLARVALSPNTFGAAIQLISDNLSGGAPRVPWADSFEAGAQRNRYESGVRGIYRYYLGYRFDTDRVDYFEEALNTLTANGVQVIGYIHPLHAWREEAMFRAGRSNDYFALRAQLTNLFEIYNDRPNVQACTQEGSAVLWDFSGYQNFSGLPAPNETQEIAHEAFYEPSHYLPHIGQKMLNRMRGENGTDLFQAEHFGVRLTPDMLAQSQNNIINRRQNWLTTQTGRDVTALLDGVIAANPSAEFELPVYLTRDDWMGLRDALSEIPDSSMRDLPPPPRTR